MRIVTALTVLLAATPLFAEDWSGKAREFNESVKDVPRVSMQKVGVITAPLPDWREFGLPGTWRPVKMITDTSVYIVKEFHHFLHADIGDSRHKNYVLWANLRGQTPEIIVWNCDGKKTRTARIAKLDRLNAEREAKVEQRRAEAQQNRERREKERQLRRSARQEERTRQDERKQAVLQARHQELLGMQQPLADAALDRVRTALISGEGKVNASVVKDEENMITVRQNLMAVMAVQQQMRDIQWCDAIQKHIAPNMWRGRGLFRNDRLKDSDPEAVILWLLREIERQAEIAEVHVNHSESMLDDTKIMEAERP